MVHLCSTSRGLARSTYFRLPSYAYTLALVYSFTPKTQRWATRNPTSAHQGSRIATFPDLIVTLDAGSSLPLTSAEIKRGDGVLVVAVPRELVPIGAGARDPEAPRQVEEAIGKKRVGL